MGISSYLREILYRKAQGVALHQCAAYRANRKNSCHLLHYRPFRIHGYKRRLRRGYDCRYPAETLHLHFGKVISVTAGGFPIVRDQTAVKPRILRRLLAIAVPITAGRYLNTSLRTVENLLVQTASPDSPARGNEPCRNSVCSRNGNANPVLSLLTAVGILHPFDSRDIRAAVLHQKKRSTARSTNLCITCLCRFR